MTIRYGSALNCIDGRTQIPVINWMKENEGVDYVDLITEPGMDRVLSHGRWLEVERIRENLIISIEAHDSHIVAVVGHYDCAANPVNMRKHLHDIAASMFVVNSWGLPVRIVGLWVDEYWQVQVVRPQFIS